MAYAIATRMTLRRLSSWISCPIGSFPPIRRVPAVLSARLLGVKKELNCDPMLPDLMQKGVYVSYTPRFKITEALGSYAVGD